MALTEETDRNESSFEGDSTINSGEGLAPQQRVPSPDTDSTDGSGTHLVNHNQPELDLGIPTEAEAHEVWLMTDGKGSLSDWAHSVLSQRVDYEGLEYEELHQGLMIEGAAALKAWKKDKGSSLKNYTFMRMIRRLPRLVSQLNMNDIRETASINQLQKYDAIKRAFDTFDEMVDEWVKSGEDKLLFMWLHQDLIYGDEPNREGDKDHWETVVGYRGTQSAEEDLISFRHMNDQEIWDWLFKDETLPLWSQNLDADDMRVIAERRNNPDASAREIGRILNHTHKWVIARDKKIKAALEGFQGKKKTLDP
jgi:hypothetical protein